MSEQVDDFLEHFGVVGMKWGKRNGSSDSSSGGSAKSAKLTRGGIDKAKLKSARKDIRNDVKERLVGNKKKKGAMAAIAIIGGAPGASLAVGIASARSAGFTKGQSLAIGFVGGAPGALLMSEMRARKTARGED